MQTPDVTGAAGPTIVQTPAKGGSRYEDGFDRGRGSDAIENVRAKRPRGKTEEYACRSGRLLLGPPFRG